MYISMFYNNQYTKGAGYSDLPFHLNLISSFSIGCNFKRNSFFNLISPFYSKEPLAYSFIPNFHSSLLISTGLTTIRYSLLISSILICFSLFIGIYSITYYFCNSHKFSSLSIFIFLTLGGINWINFFNSNIKNDPSNDWIFNIGQNQFSFWFHSILHILIPQRSALWSLPLCFWGILTLFIGVEKKNQKMMILSGIIIGLLPQIQVHSFICLAQYSIFLFLITFKFEKKHLLFWLNFI